MYFSLYINIENRMLSSQNIWEAVGEKVQKNPNLFKKYETDHDLKKLNLEKITAQDLPKKIFHLKQICDKINDQFSKNWIENEYRVFIWFVLVLGEVLALHPKKFKNDEWSLVSAQFKKPIADCKYFYLCTLKSKTDSWNKEQDEIISQLMLIPKFQKKWTDLGLELYRRSNQKHFRKPKTIRERWSSHLNPEVNKFEWQQDEEIILFQKVLQIGKKWSKISNILGTRSEHAVKNRYHHLINLKCRELGQVSRSISHKQEMQMVQEHLWKLKNQNQIKEQPPKQEQQQEPYVVGYFFHPIIFSSMNFF